MSGDLATSTLEKITDPIDNLTELIESIRVGDGDDE